MLKCLYAKLESEPMNYYQSLNSNIDIHINLTQKLPYKEFDTQNPQCYSPLRHTFMIRIRDVFFFQPTRKQAFRVIVCCEM